MGKKNRVPTKAAPVKRKQRGDPECRKKVKRGLGLPEWGRYAPERFKRQRTDQVVSLAPRKPAAAAVGSMAALVANAQRSETEFARRTELLNAGDGSQQQKAKFSTYRAYYKEFRKVIEASDVILEVLDARDPLGCRCLAIEKSVDSEFNGKKKFILLLNKIDLVPREVAEQWLEELRSELPVVAFTTMKGPMTRKCIDCLFKLLNVHSRGDGIKKKIAVGVIGFPNVGKSSIINSLKRSTVVAVGNTPGFTKVAAEVHLNSNIRIMDCPGIIFSDADSPAAVLRNAIKVESLEDPLSPVELILERCDPEKLRTIYAIGPFKGSTDFLTQIAARTGKIGKRAEPMLEDAARLVLRDWNDGRIPFYTVPVAKAGFHISPLQRGEPSDGNDDRIILEGLPSIKETQNVFAPATVARYETGPVKDKRQLSTATADIEPTGFGDDDDDEDSEDEEEEEEEGNSGDEDDDDGLGAADIDEDDDDEEEEEE
eukprot:NODE_1054_length_1737_cov_9.406991_g931_i0.p1 GENE.NODE_1054_length_1737_cov_9.406991_g931_i0~~NODE_1054_length_1737_cov_9.406991_g931_i0.p1  ORF type:complete len:485 (-),score=130.74 NODE_1054_length_1737_cov_9.406991_g931_i0:137-1591(-)